MIQETDIRAYRDKAIALRTKRDMLSGALERAETARAVAEGATGVIAKSRVLLQDAARRTQEQLEVRLSSIVSKALASVFPEPYEFQLRFVDKRGRTECELLFTRDGQEIDPLQGSGGGPVDVASFALRLAVWSLGSSRPLLILDEPFKWVSPDLHEACAEMLRALSQQLGVQVVMISHLPGIIASADKVFEVVAGKMKERR